MWEDFLLKLFSMEDWQSSPVSSGILSQLMVLGCMPVDIILRS